MLKILEVHTKFKIDAEAVAKAWPASKGDPSPRALRERLAKIRELARTAGHLPLGGNGTANSTSSTSTTGDPRTPRTPRKRPSTGSSNGGSSSKRKRGTPRTRNGKGGDDRGDDEEDVPMSSAGAADGTSNNADSSGEEGLEDMSASQVEIKKEYEEVTTNNDSDEMNATPSKTSPKVETASIADEKYEEDEKAKTNGWTDESLNE